MKPLNVFGKAIPLKFQEGLIESEGALAIYDYDSQTITFEARLRTDLKHLFLSTLLHEMGHAIFHRAGLHQATIPVYLEEIITEQFATVLTENFNLTRKR
jgi:Zn-dependent peptidase ImmA (M78 family)